MSEPQHLGPVHYGDHVDHPGPRPADAQDDLTADDYLTTNTPKVFVEDDVLPSTVVWASMADAMAIHGHDGRTNPVFDG